MSFGTQRMSSLCDRPFFFPNDVEFMRCGKGSGKRFEGRGSVSAVFGWFAVRVSTRLSDIDRERLISSHLNGSCEALLWRDSIFEGRCVPEVSTCMFEGNGFFICPTWMWRTSSGAKEFGSYLRCPIRFEVLFGNQTIGLSSFSVT